MISFYHRENKKIEVEKVMAGGILEWLYRHFLGKFFLLILTRRFISQISGLFQDTKKSAKKIPQFISDYDIKLDHFILDFPKPPYYKTFNSFFIRRYKDGMRKFVTDLSIMPAFCEARYFASSSISPHDRFPVKGKHLTAKELLNHSPWANEFEGGPIIIARLCPVDYHWFHFPDDGKVLVEFRLEGKYDSVSPLALKEKSEVFCENERHVTILETKNFGKLAYIEVAALCVGRIEQTYKQMDFKRGEAKGHFLFGGSTVILLGTKGAWAPDDDILYYSSQKTETYLTLGSSLAKKL